MAIKKEILDELLKDKDPKTMFSSDGLLGELKKALAERVLNAEMDHHLSDSRQDEVSEGENPANHRQWLQQEDGADGERSDRAPDWLI
jgi:transposase-like protein